MKWPTTATVVHINIIIKSYLSSLLNSFFSPFSNARTAGVSKHRGRQREVSTFSDRKGKAITWHGTSKYRYGDQNISLFTRLSKLFPHFSSAAVSHAWVLFSEIVMLIRVSQIEFDPKM
jgi:hypothetical protein